MTQLIPDDHVIVLFGATGDLAKRKLPPGLVPPRRPGTAARSATASSAPRLRASPCPPRSSASTQRTSVREFGIVKPPARLEDVRGRTRLRRRGSRRPEATPRGRREGGAAIGGHPRLLAPPRDPARRVRVGVGMLGATRLERGRARDHREAIRHGSRSARALNATMHKVFDEYEIFRIDHFLGKEAIDNILAFRFANGLFEPIWNRNHVSTCRSTFPRRCPSRDAPSSTTRPAHTAT